MECSATLMDSRCIGNKYCEGEWMEPTMGQWRRISILKSNWNELLRAVSSRNTLDVDSFQIHSTPPSVSSWESEKNGNWFKWEAVGGWAERSCRSCLIILQPGKSAADHVTLDDISERRGGVGGCWSGGEDFEKSRNVNTYRVAAVAWL